MTATLVRWAPFPKLDMMEHRVQHVLGNLGIAPAILPAVDVDETPIEFVVELEVPGNPEQELCDRDHEQRKQRAAKLRLKHRR